jgi:hypothetical protein
MRRREEAIHEILKWLREGRAVLGLNGLEYDPLAPVREDRLNAIHVHCVRDRTVKEANRDRWGYPKVQEAEVVFECWLAPNADHADFYENFLRVMFAGRFADPNTRIRMTEKVGPFDGGVPGAKVLQIHTVLQYPDSGIA